MVGAIAFVFLYTPVLNGALQGSRRFGWFVSSGIGVALSRLLLALPVSLMLLNNAPTSAYFAETVSAWEQGRFIRFYGLIQWLGWAWPFAAVLQLLVTLTRRAPVSPAS